MPRFIPNFARVRQHAAPKSQTMPNDNMEVDFRRSDAVRVEFKKKGGTWTPGAILTSSPGTFSIIPESPGDAENLEIRAIFLQKNQPFGDYSPIYSVVASG
ncbi:MAG: hypothetical protein KIS76_04065 [Pyrinomonadaceae bacterium]|nr:hypothetical protein [Pyrinomonadaceae bacterium]